MGCLPFCPRQRCLAWAPANPRPDETLIRALARAHRWKRLLDEGRYRSASEIAEAENIARSYITRLLKLTLLAPDIQEAILEGRPAKGMQLEELTGLMPNAWEQQHERVACP
jgi:ParB-like chromosome segregation protein Spo0J